MLLGFAGWAGVLFAQNYSFTYVSRARNSGSLSRHFKAAIFSNGSWIASQMLMLGPMFDYLTGRHGHLNQLIAASVYTTFTVAGSLVAHFVSKRTEKGAGAVGASARYAQIPVEEWERMKTYAPVTLSDWENVKAALNLVKALPTPEEFQRVRGLSETAYDITVGLIPDSGIRACKVGGLTVTTGLPDKQ